MVLDFSAARRVYMFIDGLDEPLHGLVKYTKSTTLHDAIERARDLHDDLTKVKENFQHKPSFPSKGKEEKVAPSKESSYKKPLDDDVRRDLRRRKLCFTCQESWAPRHRCAVGKAHYKEVFLDVEEEEEDEPRRGHNADTAGGEPTPSGDGNREFAPIGGALTSLRGVLVIINFTCLDD